MTLESFKRAQALFGHRVTKEVTEMIRRIKRRLTRMPFKRA
jgi:hypothetical protein